MEIFLTFLHVIVCLLLVVVILLQPGKSPGMGGAFGGASSGSFGAKSPTTVLSKFTVVMAVAFMFSSLTLAWMSVRDHSVRIDLGPDTHYPSPGLALPGDLSISPEAQAGEGAAPEAEPVERGFEHEGSDEQGSPMDAAEQDTGSPFDQ